MADRQNLPEDQILRRIEVKLEALVAAQEELKDQVQSLIQRQELGYRPTMMGLKADKSLIAESPLGASIQETPAATVGDDSRRNQESLLTTRVTGELMHDLNNLMTVVVGLSEFGRNETGPQHKTHRYFNQIYDSGQMCVTLARQLLVFNKELNNLQTMDLNETVTGMVPLVDHITGTTIELEMDLRATQPLVKAEYAGIGQIILNLVINARDAMPEGGRLAIISRMAKHKAIGSLPAGVPAGVFVEFIIRDTGSGIPLEIQQRVFEPYFSTKAAAHGTGLGLSIVRRIVERFGGYMTLSSTAGVGTAVHVFMPQVIAERSVPRVEDLEEKTPAKGDIILVVEDEEVIRDLTKKCLEMIGYRILTAPNAVEAMPLFGQHQTDIRLLLVDIKLEGMSGVELLKELRQKKPALKVLIMSGVIGHESVHDLIQMDGCQFIQKPFTTTQLAQAVRQSLTCSSTTIDI